MRIGIVCPYSWDVPGGVSAHVADLAEALIQMGHLVSVLAPAEFDELLPDYVVSTGKPRAVKYNGSVARLSFGPIAARKVSKWIEEGEFDVLHVHEPLATSLSVLACWAAKGPIVATWHS
jgi:phosphatidylinositol alpha-mannosyltransferase